MDSKELKFAIKRRLYKRKRDANETIHPSLAVFFKDCPICSGRGKVCTEWEDDGIPVASLDTCSLCDGDGFIHTSSS